MWGGIEVKRVTFAIHVNEVYCLCVTEPRYQAPRRKISCEDLPPSSSAAEYSQAKRDINLAQSESASSAEASKSKSEC